jgi:5-methylcytosine-specific restriction endonuclease McrA
VKNDDFTFDGFDPSNTTPVCWMCQRERRRCSREWAKSGFVQSQLCQWCYGDLMKKVIRHKQRAWNSHNTATLTTIQWATILHSSEGKCHYCQKQIGYHMLTLEHLIPVSKGGGTTSENCIPACMDCNHKSWEAYREQV